MKLYLDTSALVKLYVEEEGSAMVREAVAAAETVATAMIAYVEARAAFSRRRRERRLSRKDYHQTVSELEGDWEQYVVLEVTRSVIRRAADLTNIHPLRAYDAIHLASATLLKERVEGPIFFASWDWTLASAAKREGLSLVPIR
ncbi:MAG: type II toxin-antitoxin system VapC family toxin [Candidatus Binatia bacterium]